MTARHLLARKGVAFIFIAGVLDVMAMGLVIPVLPGLIERFAGSPAAAGLWNGVLIALWAAMQFLCSPLIGSLSDRFGRRPIIMLSTAGLAIDWALMALAPDLWWLALGRVIGGITSSSFTAIYAYMADITAPEERAGAYGLVGAAFALGFVAGPALGGVLSLWGLRAPFWVASALSAVAFVYGWLVLPESLPRERRMPFAWSRANPLGALRLIGRHRELSGYAIVYLLLHFAHHVFSTVFVLYAGRRFGFTPFDVGLMLALAGILDMIVQALLVGRVARRLGDRPTMVIGLLFGSAGLALMGLAPAGWIFVAAIIPNALWALALPTLMSLMTRLVSEREQGQLQGAANSVASIAGALSPLFFGWLYALSIVHAPGLSFLVAAAILATAALVAALVTARAARG